MKSTNFVVTNTSKYVRMYVHVPQTTVVHYKNSPQCTIRICTYNAHVPSQNLCSILTQFQPKLVETVLAAQEDECRM